MSNFHEIEKKLKKGYSQYSDKLNEDGSQEKLNELYYDSLLAVIKVLDTQKSRQNFSKPFVQTSKPFVSNKVPRKRNPFSGNSSST